MGTTTASVTVNAVANDGTVTAGTVGHYGFAGHTLCHTTYVAVVTDNSAATTTWTQTAAKVVAAPADTGVGYSGQAIASGPASCTTMKGVTTYGATTLTPTTDAAFFDSTITAATVASAAAVANVMAVGDSITAVFNMPTEADTYPDVPRLSPADTDGWVSYAPDVTASATYGKNLLQLSTGN